MKTLPKALRPDHRYFRIKVDAKKQKDFGEAVKLVRKAVKDFAGDKGLSEVDPYLLKSEYGFEDQEAVVRIEKGLEEVFRASILLSDERIYTLNVSGAQSSV
ncbi:MAG: hypothetical protein ACLFTA_00610 [Candidatus Nanohaloarchaea archaeon]